MKNSLDAAFNALPSAPYAAPKHLIPWIPFIRVAKWQGWLAQDIALALVRQLPGAAITAAQVVDIVASQHGRRHHRPINDLLDQHAADIDRHAAAGVSEQRICLWLAVNHGLAVHQCQLNAWRRARRSDALRRHNVP